MQRFPMFLLGAAWAMAGCATWPAHAPAGPSPSDPAAETTSLPAYQAPTLPPEYTPTPTATITPTSLPTPTPFLVVMSTATAVPEGESTPSATPAIFSGPWQRYESVRLGAAIHVPPQLKARDFGQSITVGNAHLDEGITPLFMEICFDTAGSYRLPEGIDASNPEDVLRGVLRELEQTYTEVVLVRPPTGIVINGIQAAEAAARARLVSGAEESNLNWYLAVAIRDQTVVRFYASSPASASVIYLSVAEGITNSFTFLE